MKQQVGVEKVKKEKKNKNNESNQMKNKRQSQIGFNEKEK